MNIKQIFEDQSSTYHNKQEPKSIFKTAKYTSSFDHKLEKSAKFAKTKTVKKFQIDEGNTLSHKMSKNNVDKQTSNSEKLIEANKIKTSNSEKLIEAKKKWKQAYSKEAIEKYQNKKLQNKLQNKFTTAFGDHYDYSQSLSKTQKNTNETGLLTSFAQWFTSLFYTNDK